MRPRQWFKSLYVVFGSVPAIILSPYMPVMISSLLFLGIVNMILIQGVIYSINDITDMEKDKIHPKKRKRPLPSGKITLKEAKVFAVFLFLTAIAMAFYLDFRIVLIDVALVAINLVYSLKPIRLKDKKYFDIFVTGLNFPLRVGVGWYLFEPLNRNKFHFLYSIISNEIISSNSIQAIFFNTPPRIINFYTEFSTITLSFLSMMTLTYFLAVFLLSLKRLGEKLWVEKSEKARPVLKYYSTSSLKAVSFMSLFFTTASFFFLAYSLKISLMFMTFFLVCMMVWYYRLTFKKDSPVKNPEEIFTKNRKFIFSGGTFLAVMLILLLI